MKRLLILFMALALAGCASVKVSTLDSTKYIESRRGDVITTGTLSQQTDESLFILGYDTSDCLSAVDSCIHQVQTQGGLSKEQRQSALSEIWLYKALRLNRELSRDYRAMTAAERNELSGKTIAAFLQSARAAYLYLFYSNRTIDMRALEDRQTQVRDYYNLSAQTAVQLLYQRFKEMPPEERSAPSTTIDGWTLASDSRYFPPLQNRDQIILDITADSTISFKGIRNEYVKDGLGARMILTLGREHKTSHKGEKRPDFSWRRMPYVPATMMLHFPGNTYRDVALSKTAILTPYEIDSDIGISINKIRVPLAANYSAAYGLWLANSDFARQSLGTIFGKGDVLEKPIVYLMQPYRPNRRTVILIHGLASSPEAWVNTANEIMGDDELRDRYQIWQVYYPTNWPIVSNRKAIASAIRETFAHYDPEGRDPASRDVVLIGHSMGGILSRLLVSSSENVLWDQYLATRHPNEQRQKLVREKLHDIFFFEPLPNVTRAVFLAAPHRGTPYTEKTLPRLLLSLVKLPVSVLSTVTNSLYLMMGQDVSYNPDSMTGVGNLSDKDPTIQALIKAPISPRVKYYSIIGDNGEGGTIETSSDGIVPYWSSHLEGAASETIIPSGHSVQETPKAILQIRSILREHLAELDAAKAASKE